MNLIVRFIGGGFVTRLSSENVEFKVKRAKYIRWFFHSILSKMQEIIKFLICLVIFQNQIISDEKFPNFCILLSYIDGKTIAPNNITFWRISNYFFTIWQYDRTKFNTLYSVSMPPCHPENSKLLKTVNHKGTFPILEIDGSLRIGVEKSYFNSNRIEHSHANVQSYSPHFGNSM